MIHELLNHPDFAALVQKMRNDLTRIVMSEATADEERELALTKYHLLNDILAEMGSTIGETNV